MRLIINTGFRSPCRICPITYVQEHLGDARGGDVNWKITEYQKSIDEPDFIEGIYALLKKTNGKGRAATYLMNCSDVYYIEWDKEFKAPPLIFE